MIIQLCFLPHLHSFRRKTFRCLAEKHGLGVEFWNQSERKDEICMVLFRRDSQVAQKVVQNREFSYEREDAATSGDQVKRFPKIWWGQMGSCSSGAILNWSNSNHLQELKSIVQSFDSVSTWDTRWRVVFRLLMLKRAMAMRLWRGFNRGDGFLTSLLSRPETQVTDYNYLVYTQESTEESGVPTISMSNKVPLLIK